jgi:hypothetical protein
MGDPSWFYSTLAQSSAAIVGLAGGFMVSRILAQRTEISDDRLSTRDAFLVLEAEIQRRVRLADEVHRAVAENLQAIQELKQIHQSSNIRSFTHEGIQAASSIGVGSDELRLLKQLQDDAAMIGDSYRVLARTPKDLAHRLRKGKDLDDIGEDWLREGLPNYAPGGNFVQALPLQRDWLAEEFAELKRQYKGVQDQLNALRSRVAIPTLVGLLLVLGAFLAGGVVAPFFFLTAQKGSSREILIGLFIVLGSLFLAYLAIEIRRLSNALNLQRPFY